MTSTQLAAIAYRLGAIDIIAAQIYQLTLELDELQEGSLSVKLELTLKAFDERAAEHRKTLNQFPMKSPLIPHQAGKGDKQRPTNKKTYDDNYNEIFRPKNRGKHQEKAQEDVLGEGHETDDARPADRPRNQYNRRLGPDGQTLFIVAH